MHLLAIMFKVKKKKKKRTWNTFHVLNNNKYLINKGNAWISILSFAKLSY